MVKGIFVRGILRLKLRFIPLTIIPLTNSCNPFEKIVAEQILSGTASRKQFGVGCVDGLGPFFGELS